MGKIIRKVGVVTGALSVAYFVLWGCMPTGLIPPPLPSADSRDLERGVAVNVLAFDGNPSKGDWYQPQDYSAGGGLQGWLLQPGEDGDKAFLIHAGWPNVMGIGRMYRAPLVQNEKAYLGLSGSIGLAWLNAGLPMSVAVNDRVWLYSQPSLAPVVSQKNLGVRIPIGLVHETKSGNRIIHELGFRQQADLSFNRDENDPLLNTFYYSLGMSQAR